MSVTLPKGWPQQITEENAELLGVTALPATTDVDLQRRWDARQLSKNEIAGAVKAMRLRLTVNDPQASRQEYPGLYRVASVQAVERNGIPYIVETLKFGFATKLDWTEARVTKEDESPADAAQDSAKWIEVLIPNLDYRCIKAITAEVTASRTKVDPKFGGETYTGTWNLLVVGTTRVEDGSGNIRVLFGLPQFTLAGFTDYAGSRQADQTYYFDVPKALAQGILTAAKAIGVSARVSSYRREQGVVDIVVSTQAALGENLTLEGASVVCDTIENYYYAWGYTNAQIQVFLAAHSAQLDPGYTRQIRNESRGDGYFDATVIERYTAYVEAKHLFNFTTFSGDSMILSAWEMGWNAPMATLNTIKADYDNVVAGQDSSFKVTRQDNCTFDYIAVINTYAARQATFETIAAADATKGVMVKAVSEDEAAAVPTTVQAGARKRHELSAEKNVRGQFKYVYTEKTVQSVAAGTTVSEKQRIIGGANVDALPGEVGGYTVPAGWVIQSGMVYGQDDGTLQYHMILLNTGSPVTGTATFGTPGETIVVTKKEHDTPANVAAVASAQAGEVAEGKGVNVRFELGNEDVASWEKQTIQKNKQAPAETLIVGSALFPETHTVAINDLSSTVGTTLGILAAPATGLVKRLQIQVTELGNVHYTLVSIAPVATDSGADTVVSDDGISKTTKRIYKNQTAPPTVAAGQRVENYQMTESKLYDYDIVKKALSITTPFQHTSQHTAYTEVQIERLKTRLNHGWYFDLYEGMDYDPAVFVAYMMKSTRTVNIVVVDTYGTSRTDAAVTGTGELVQKSCIVKQIEPGLWVSSEQTVTYGNWTRTVFRVQRTEGADGLVEPANW